MSRRPLSVIFDMPPTPSAIGDARRRSLGRVEHARRRSAGRARLAGDRLDRAVIAGETPAPGMEDPQPPLGAPDGRARDADDGDLPPPVPVVGPEVREPVAGL